MLTLAIITTTILFFAFLVIVKMGAVLLENDEHYQRIKITVHEDEPNSYTAFTMSAANTVTSVWCSKDLEPEFVPDAFGKNKHGVLCWDLKRLDASFPGEPPEPDNATDLQEFWFMGDNRRDPEDLGTTVPASEDSDCVECERWTIVNTDEAAGDILNTYDRIHRYDQPMDIIDGTSFHQLLTWAHYYMTLRSAGMTAAGTWTFSMKARRVLVPLLEVYFDSQQIDWFLSGLALAQLRD